MKHHSWHGRLLGFVALMCMGTPLSVQAADETVTQARLTIYSEVDCALSVRGQPAGEVPARAKDWRMWVDAGPMEVACTSARGNRDIQTVEVRAGATRRLRFDPDYLERFTELSDGFIRDSQHGLVWMRKATRAASPAAAMQACRDISRHNKEGRVANITELDLLADAPANLSAQCGTSICRVPTWFDLGGPMVFADHPALRWFDLSNRSWGYLPERLEGSLEVLCVWSDA